MGITEKYCENTYIAKEVDSLLRRVFNRQIKANIIDSCLQIENPYIKLRRCHGVGSSDNADPPQRREHPSRREILFPNCCSKGFNNIVVV